MTSYRITIEIEDITGRPRMTKRVLDRWLGTVRHLLRRQGFRVLAMRVQKEKNDGC